MPAFFSADESALFFRLYLSLLLVEFGWPGSRWQEAKKRTFFRSGQLYGQSLIAGLMAYVFAGTWPRVEIIPLVAATYGVIDYGRLRRNGQKPLLLFLYVQGGYLLAISCLWLILTDNWRDAVRLVERILTDQNMMAILTGYVLCSAPLGHIVGMATAKWQKELATTGGSDTLADAGRWIGILERMLILTFVLLAQYEAIGFLIAAKSLLRFREGDRGQKHSEYVLVGTLMSYGLAILIGLLIKLALE